MFSPVAKVTTHIVCGFATSRVIDGRSRSGSRWIRIGAPNRTDTGIFNLPGRTSRLMSYNEYSVVYGLLNFLSYGVTKFTPILCSFLSGFREIIFSLHAHPHLCRCTEYDL